MEVSIISMQFKIQVRLLYDGPFRIGLKLVESGTKIPAYHQNFLVNSSHPF